MSEPIRAEFCGNRVRVTHDGYDGFGSVFLTDDEAEKLRVALYAVTKQAREREEERRAEAAKPKTVRVRIAVAVDGEGHYAASGCHCDDNDHDEGEVFEHLESCLGYAQHPRHVVFVEADVPLPSQVVVEGEVSRD